MTILLGLDFETSGIDAKTDKIIEAGFCLWEVGRGPLEMKSYFVHQNVQLTEDNIKIHGITQELMEGGVSEFTLIKDLYCYHDRADYWVAHNAPFEAKFAGELFSGCASQPRVTWIDTMQDIPQHAGKKLIHAAAEEGFVNPFPHRALPDVLTMMTLLAKFDFTEIERYATSPSRRLMVTIRPFSEERNAKIKALGWRWDGDRKCWYKNCKEFNIAAEAEKAKAEGFQPYAERVQEGAA